MPSLPVIHSHSFLLPLAHTPSLYLPARCSMPFLPLGSTLLARQSLAQSGWAVVVLPWYEWATLPVSPRHFPLPLFLSYECCLGMSGAHRLQTCKWFTIPRPKQTLLLVSPSHSLLPRFLA